MIAVWHKVAHVIGALLLIGFLALAFLSTFFGGGSDYCTPTPRGADCGGSVIGPVALLTGQVSLWDVPLTIIILVLGGWLVLRGYRPKTKSPQPPRLNPPKNT